MLEPLSALDENLASIEQEIAGQLTARAQLLCSGMLLAMELKLLPRPIMFRVIAVEPESGRVTDGTRVVLRSGRLMPGAAANLVTFADIGGLAPQIEQIRELVEMPLRFPEVFENLGIEVPRGVLLCGPPGSGKTYLAKALANEIGARFFYINGPEVVSSLHGGTEANLRQIFNDAMEHRPAIVLIDEIDAIAPVRGESGLQADVRMGTQLLSLLDGLVNMEEVVCCSKVIMSGVNGNVIMSGWKDDNPDNERRETTRRNSTSISQRDHRG
ncbi:MAG: AAA family ATPase [Deltaproteobacteria bacterium]|nr:AAA family ATPase [Deltaproteobacteria bacterium]